MAVTVGTDGIVSVNGTQSIFPRDGINHSIALVGGFDGDNIVLGQFTDDGKLKVDAVIDASGITIGDVNMSARAAGGTYFPLGEVLNPDATSYALWVQDQRMTFTDGSLNVGISAIALPTGASTVAAQNSQTTLLAQIEDDLANPVNSFGIPTYDYVLPVYASTTTAYQYKTGGSGGTLVGTLTITYTDSSKTVIDNVLRT